MPISETHNIDCMEFMSGIPDGFFDLVVADPPYGINAPKMQMGSNPTRKGNGQYPGESVAVKIKKGRLNSGSGKLKNRLLNQSNFNWDDKTPDDSFFAELRRVSKNQIIWGGNYFNLGPSRGFAVWNKMQPWDNFSQAEFAWTSFDIPAKLFSLSNTGGSNNEKKFHPTQKPVALYKWLLKNYARPGQKIFDPMMGSQSSRIAAWDMGLDFEGCEIDSGYYSDGEVRFEAHISKPTIFAPEETYTFKQTELFQ